MSAETAPTQTTTNGATTPADGAPKPGSFADLLGRYEAQMAAEGTEPEEAATVAETPAAKAKAKEQGTGGSKDAAEGDGAETDDGAELDVEQLKRFAKEGDAASVLKALGFDKSEKVAAKHWADFRERSRKIKSELDARTQTVASKEQELQSLASTLEQRYSGFAEAKKLYDAGDLIGALQAAFGEQDIDKFASDVVKLKVSRDPEAHRKLLALERKDKEREEQARKLAEQQAQQQAQQEHAQRERAYLQSMHGALAKTQPELIQRAEKTGKLGGLLTAIMNIQKSEYEATGEELSHDEALERFSQHHSVWGSVLAKPDQSGSTTATPDQPGSTAERQGRRRAVSHQRARSAGGSRLEETYEQRLARYGNALGQALTRD